MKQLCVLALALTFVSSALAAHRNPRSLSAIRQVFGKRAGQAECIASHEAGASLKPTAVSPTGDHGLFQINARSWFGKVARWSWGPRGYRRFYVQRRFIYDPLYNAKVAFVISRGGTNWRPWSSYSVHGYCH